jgi:hypothetical protein
VAVMSMVWNEYETLPSQKNYPKIKGVDIYKVGIGPLT